MIERSEIVASWERRAGAYRDLTERWPLFRTIAGRLVDELPGGFAETFVDLGAGAGLLSALVVERHPAARPVLVEPSPAMLSVARSRLGSRLSATHDAPAEDVGALGLRAGAALASAAAHLFDDDRVLAGLARVLEPGAIYAFNLWGHSFESTAGEPAVDWRGEIGAVFAELGLPQPEWPAPNPPRVRRRADLERLARETGFELVHCSSDVDESSAALDLDFALLSPTWLAGVPAESQDALLARARERLDVPKRVHSTRVVMRFR